MNLSVTIYRTGLSLPPLVISNYPSADTAWWLPEDGLVRPGWSFRTTEAPESAYLPGSQPLAAVLDSSTLPLTVYAKAAGEATLEQVESVLELAVSQFRYALTVDIDGATTTYVAYPAWPQWGAVDSGMVAAGLSRCSLTIPINPAEV